MYKSLGDVRKKVWVTFLLQTTSCTVRSFRFHRNSWSDVFDKNLMNSASLLPSSALKNVHNGISTSMDLLFHQRKQIFTVLRCIAYDSK